jgi:hypothetical protein
LGDQVWKRSEEQNPDKKIIEEIHEKIGLKKESKGVRLSTNAGTSQK